MVPPVQVGGLYVPPVLDHRLLPVRGWSILVSRQEGFLLYFPDAVVVPSPLSHEPAVGSSRHHQVSGLTSHMTIDHHYCCMNTVQEGSSTGTK